MENKNQPAYPIPKDRSLEDSCKNGLTKREYFAAMAMQGMLSNSVLTINAEALGLIPEAALRIADYLLKQLENGK